ncbi:tetratricopeptide repeat protein [Helicobacter sp. T3_23-1056]
MSKRNHIFLYAWILAIVFLSGCATNPFAKFYTSHIDREKIEQMKQTKSYPTIKELGFVDRVKTFGLLSIANTKFIKAGCHLIGESHFSGELNDIYNAEIKAKRVKSNLFVVYAEYSHTAHWQETRMEVVGVSSTHSASKAKIFGSYVFGSTNTTTTHTAPVTREYSADIYNQGATYYLCPSEEEMEANERKEQAVLSKACGSKNYEACLILGNYYHLYYDDPDSRNTIKYWNLACDKGNIEVKSTACYNLGVLYSNGESINTNLRLSAQYHKTACALNYALSCVNLGVFYERGASIRQSLFEAKEHYGKGCDLGEELGCEKFKELNEQRIELQ